MSQMNNVTLVTGLWNLGREHLSEGWSRNFEHYLNNLLYQQGDLKQIHNLF